MTWQLAVLFKVLAGSLVAPFVFYLLGKVGPRERIAHVAFMFTWAFGFAIAIAGIPTEFPPTLWPITLVGALVVVGVYFQLRAVALSPSLSAIFVSLTSLIPLFMSGFQLGEWNALADTTLLGGVVLAISGIALWIYQDVHERRRKGEPDVVPRSFWFHGTAFAVVLGIAIYLQNVWAKGGVSPDNFVFAWYGGTLLGAGVLFLVSRTFPRGEKRMGTPKEVILTGIAGLVIVTSMWFQYMSFALVAQTLVMPIYAVGDVVGYAAVGIVVGVITQKWATIRGLKGLALAMGLAGAIIIALAH